MAPSARIPRRLPQTVSTRVVAEQEAIVGKHNDETFKGLEEAETDEAQASASHKRRNC